MEPRATKGGTKWQRPAEADVAEGTGEPVP